MQACTLPKQSENEHTRTPRYTSLSFFIQALGFVREEGCSEALSMIFNGVSLSVVDWFGQSESHFEAALLITASKSNAASGSRSDAKPEFGSLRSRPPSSPT